jgi:ATP-binding cassette subfamily B protein
MYYQAFQRGQGFLRDLLSNLVSLYENSLFLKDFYDFLDLQPVLVELSPSHPIPCPWQTGLQFHNVSFDYPNSQRSVLKEVSFTLHPGETIALVGANGAGKTSLIKLLCRLYEPTAGQITLDGIDLRQFSTVEWRNQISVLFQDYGRYQLTAGENIWLGNTSLPPDHAAIDQAARWAGADTVVEQLPAGYATQLGTEFAAGEELSIGQWQKIALARGFVSESPLVILDEPTSALDAKAEAEVFEKFHQLTQDKTAILISHRLSTIKLADRILVLSQGRLVESGTHDELMQHNGLYANLFETQAHPYR